MLRIIAIGLVIMACFLSALSAQELRAEQNPQVILFHVTSVQHADGANACSAGACSAIKYTIEGYAEMRYDAAMTEYVLTCDEYIVRKPHPHRNNICARVHAGNTYTVELLSDSVSFPYSRLNKDFEANYSIVSERETGGDAALLISRNGR